MPRTHPPYPPEFKRQMLELVRAGRTPQELSREFEPSAQAIRNWMWQTDLDAGRRSDGLILRQGIIARIQDWLRGDEYTFLIDAPAFPGSSGGPVVLKPEGVAIKDTTPITHSLLIGMIRGYIPSRDVAVSKRTGEPRIIFEENSGLAKVVPINLIKETLALATEAAG